MMNVVAAALIASLSGGLGVFLAVLGVAGIGGGGSDADVLAALGKLGGAASAMAIMLYFLLDYKKRVEGLTADLARLNEVRAAELKDEASKGHEVLRATTVAMKEVANGLREGAQAARENSEIHRRLMERLGSDG